MMRSRVKLSTMFVLIFSLMATFCASSAKDNKPSDTKVTVFILITIAH